MKTPRIHLRDLFWIIVIVAMGCAWWLDHIAQEFRSLSLQFTSQQKIHSNVNQVICRTEHHKPGFMGTQVWQVWQQRTGEKDWEPLFTVEACFQEEEPGIPIVSKTENGLVLTDVNESYCYEPMSRRFLTNKFSDVVYVGPFRCWQPPQ